MKKFLLGFLAGAIARHYTFPNSTSSEVTEALTDALKKFNDRLEKEGAEATEAVKDKVDKVNPNRSTDAPFKPSSEENPS